MNIRPAITETVLGDDKPRVLPHVLAEAHNTMLAKLLAIRPPEIPINPSPADFGAVSDYVVKVAQAADELMREIGREVQANTTIRVNKACFKEVFFEAVDGQATFEIERAARQTVEDRLS